MDMNVKYIRDVIKYEQPDDWIKYNPVEIASALVDAKSVLISLSSIPYQRTWLEEMQEVELKREVSGTSRIEGADFTGNELDEAMQESPEKLLTRSQKQAHAAANTYRWISKLPTDYPVSAKLILEIHKRIVTGADDDHCEPGVLRKKDENVNFGNPSHRGAEGGQECNKAFKALVISIEREYTGHDPLIRAIATHYHIAAMHPFLDGNGRTARALEAMMLRKEGLKDIFIAVSNYYYDEKRNYLSTLNLVREYNFDLTPFIKFCLKGICVQAKRLLKLTKTEMSKALYREMMRNLFNKLVSKRKRVIAERQTLILETLLSTEDLSLSLDNLFSSVSGEYSKLMNITKAFERDISGLIHLGALEEPIIKDSNVVLTINLDWPSEITETEFYERLKTLPEAKTKLR